jgi:hypothetical protein
MLKLAVHIVTIEVLVTLNVVSGCVWPLMKPSGGGLHKIRAIS